MENNINKEKAELISYRAIFIDLEAILDQDDRDLILGKARPHATTRHLFKQGLFCAAFHNTGHAVPQDMEDFSWGETAKAALIRAIEKEKGE